MPALSVAKLTLTEESKVRLLVAPADKAGSWEGDLLVLFAFQQVITVRGVTRTPSVAPLAASLTTVAASAGGR